MAGQLVETAGIVAKIRADTRGFVSGLRQSQTEMKGLKSVTDSANKGFKVLGNTSDTLGKSLDSLNKKLDSMSKGLRDIGRKAQIGFAGVVAAIGMAVKQASDFELQMTRVASVSGATAKELQMLTKAARDAGAETIFSASDGAMALENLALAGFSAQESVSALRGTLDLAAAFQLDLAEATEMTAAQIRSFNLDASEADRVANVLAAGIASSMASFEKLQFSMRYTSPLFNAVGKSIEDNVAALGLLFNAGFRGQQAGTTLRMAMSRLISPTAEGQRALAKYGLTLEDVNPEVHDLSDIFRKLEPLANDTAAAMDLFTTEAAVGMQALLSQGADAFEELREKITGTTKAAEMQAAVDKTLWGQLQLLRSVTEEAAIAMGEMFMPFVRKMVGYAADLVEQFNALDDPTKKLIAKWTVGAGIGLLLVSMVSVLGFALMGLKFAVNAILRPIQFALKGISVLGGLITSVTSVLAGLSLGTILWGGIIAATLVGVYLAWKKNWGGIREVVTNVWNAIKPYFDIIKIALRVLVRSIRERDWRMAWIAIRAVVIQTWNAIKAAVGEVWEWLEPKLKRLDELTGGALTTTWNWIVEALGPLWEFIRDDVLPVLGKAFSTTWNWLIKAAGNAYAWIKDTALPWMRKAVSTAWNWSIKAVGTYLNWIKDTVIPFYARVLRTSWNWSLALLGAVWSWLRDTAWPIISSGARSAWNFTLEFLGDAWTWLRDTAWPVITEGVKNAWSFTLDFLGDSWEWIKKAWSVVTEGISNAWSFSLDLLGEAWSWVRGTGWNLITKGVSSAWEFTLNTAGTAWSTLTNVWDVLTKGASSAWKFALDGLDAFRDGRGFEFIQDAWNNLKVWDGWGKLWDWVVSKVKVSWNWITDSWSTLTSWDGWGKMWQWVVNATNVTWNWVTDTWANLTTWEGWGNLWKWVVNASSITWDWVTTSWRNLFAWDGWGSVGDWVADQATASWGWLQNGWHTLSTWDGWSDMWDWVQDSVTITWEFFKSAWNALESWEGWGRLWEWITAATVISWDFLKNAWNSLMSWTGWGNLWGWVTSAASVSWKFVSDSWGSLRSWDGWGKLWGWITSAASVSWEFLTDTWNSLASWDGWSKMGAWITDSAEVSFSFLKDSWNSLASWDGWGKARDWIKGSFTGIRSIITDPAVVSSIGDFVKGLVERMTNLGDFFSTLSENIRGQITKAMQNAKDNIAKALEAREGGMDPALKDAIVSLGLALWDGLKAAFTLAWNFATLLSELLTLAVVAIASVIAGPLIDLGQAIWDGIKTGWEIAADFGTIILASVMDKVDSMKTAGIRIAANMWLALTDWWEAHNPFKSIAGMFEVGVEWGRSLVEGVKEAFSTAKNFLSQIISNMLPDNILGNSARSILNRLGWDLPPRGFAEGGYTGDGPASAVAGVVHRGEYVIPAWMVKRLGPFIKMMEKVRSKGFQRGGHVGYQDGGMVQGGIGQLLASIGLGDLGQTLGQVMRQFGAFIKQMTDIMLSIVPDELKDRVRELANFWNSLFEEIEEHQEQVQDAQGKVNDTIKTQVKNVGWLQATLERFRNWLETNFKLGDFADALNSGFQALGQELQNAGSALLDFVGTLAQAVTFTKDAKGNLVLDWQTMLLSIAQAGLTELGRSIGALLGESAFKELERWGSRGKPNMENFNQMIKNFSNWNSNMAKLKSLEKQKATNIVAGGAAGGLLGFLVGGPIGFLIGAGLGASAGKSASKKLDQQMKDLQVSLEDTFQKISEFLGTSIGDFAGALGNAFSAETYTGFIKGFSTSLEDMTRNALMQAFLASETMAPLLEELTQSVTRAVFDGVVDEEEKQRIREAAQQAQKTAGEFFRTLKEFSLFGGSGSTSDSGGRAGTVLQNLTGPALNEFKEMLAPLNRFGEMLELLGSMNMHLAYIAGDGAIAAGAGGTTFRIDHLEVNMPSDFNGMDDLLYQLEIHAHNKSRGRGK